MIMMSNNIIKCYIKSHASWHEWDTKGKRDLFRKAGEANPDQSMTELQFVLTTRTYSNISMMAELMRMYREPLLRKALTTGSNRKFLMM